jgi:glycerol-3-phosphate dehydrogenase
MGGFPLQGGIHDLAIIGGGINGCGIARDAQGRGLSVALIEQGDLAGATSSASTKLIHGGLRYLEHYEFRLVREALTEREVLLKLAPHIIWPLRFVLPHHQGLRPWPIIRLGLFLYDHLGGRRILPPTRTLDLSQDSAGEPLKRTYRRAFEYSDCWVQDSRLVVLNARDAADKGAVILTRTECVNARRDGDRWHVTVKNRQNGEQSQIAARVIVNAGGPWVADVLHRVIGRNVPLQVRLVKGSHIIVDRLFDHGRSYIFQNTDQRICFAIPFEQDFTLIGTTDEDYSGDPSEAAITEGEIAYLLGSVNEYFSTPVRREQIRWTYAGVRPLHDNGANKAQEATRDYELKLDRDAGGGSVLSIFGGKITTYRRLAEHAMDMLSETFPQMGKAWTKTAPLPGGNLAADDTQKQIEEMVRKIPNMPIKQAERLFRCYGTLVARFLQQATKIEELGEDFGHGLTRAEVDYLIAEEWAKSVEDILWRRTKLGLKLDAAQVRRLQLYMTGNEIRVLEPARFSASSGA